MILRVKERTFEFMGDSGSYRGTDEFMGKSGGYREN